MARPNRSNKKKIYIYIYLKGERGDAPLRPEKTPHHTSLDYTGTGHLGLAKPGGWNTRSSQLARGLKKHRTAPHSPYGHDSHLNLTSSIFFHRSRSPQIWYEVSLSYSYLSHSLFSLI